ncbi:MAG: endonuclease/exonuclease/phosphatase family protein [Verrucomicrobiales bacterium]|nr:endonuclease/exonuclease/phosphatase family protein [Verrucomicrobiales bacterium]
MKGESNRRRPLLLRLTGVVEAAGMLALVATLVALLAGVHWVAALAVHYPAQYAAVLLVATILSLAGRRRSQAALFAAGMVVNLAILLPGWWRVEVPGGTAGSALRVLSMNVLASNGSYDRIRNAISVRHPEVLVVIELTPEGARQLESIHGEFPHRRLDPSPGNFGIGLYSRLPLLSCESVVIGPAGVPSLQARFRVGEREVTLVATHPVPPITGANARDLEAQLLGVGERCRETAGPVVLVGDLNTTPWSPVFRRLKKAGGLQDTLAGRGWQPTWPAPLGFAGIPIDHCLVSEEWRVAERSTGPAVGGDHLPLFVDLRLP